MSLSIREKLIISDMEIYKTPTEEKTFGKKIKQLAIGILLTFMPTQKKATEIVAKFNALRAVGYEQKVAFKILRNGATTDEVARIANSFMMFKEKQVTLGKNIEQAESEMLKLEQEAEVARLKIEQEAEVARREFNAHQPVEVDSEVSVRSATFYYSTGAYRINSPLTLEEVSTTEEEPVVEYQEDTTDYEGIEGLFADEIKNEAEAQPKVTEEPVVEYQEDTTDYEGIEGLFADEIKNEAEVPQEQPAAPQGLLGKVWANLRNLGNQVDGLLFDQE